MDQNEKVASDKIAKMESEIKVLKNEVQAVLLDLRESYLNMQNPFNSVASPTAIQPIVIQEQAPVREPQPESLLKETQKPEPVIKAEKDSPPEKDPPTETTEISELKSETTREEVKMAPDSASELELQSIKPVEPIIRKNSKLDLITVAGLTGWVEESTQKLGRERTEAVLDISEAMGYLTGDLKPILLKLIALAPESTIKSTTRTRDYVNSLIKLNSLFGKDNQQETALLLLSLASGDQNHG